MQLYSQTRPASSVQPSILTLEVGGMKCAGCVKAVENQLLQQPGVISATVNLVTELARVECESTTVDGEELAQQLTNAGFPSSLQVAEDDRVANAADPDEGQPSETHTYYQRLAIASVLLILSTIGHLKHVGLDLFLLSNIWFHFALATFALLGPGRPIILDGWKGLRHNIPNMNTLVGLGTLSAYTASLIALLVPQLGWECFFDEPVMMLGFILLGRTLEQRARGKAVKAFKALLALKPSVAQLILNPPAESSLTPLDETAANSPLTAIAPQQIQSIAADRVQVGQWVQVLPGDRIPIDGTVVVGRTTVNEAAVTGESCPVAKYPGDPVVAGSLNQTGAIAVKATRTGKETTLAQIIAFVEEAQTRKAPIQKLADTVAGYFTYGVLTTAVLTFLFWYFVGFPLWLQPMAEAGQSLAHSLTHSAMHSMSMDAADPLLANRLLVSLKLAIAVLVIACPCALGLATPTAIMVGTGIGAEQGLLIRGGDVLESVHRLQTVVFDKTGTLTSGHPTVTDCASRLEGLSRSRLLQLAAAVEAGARHPLAAAIQTAAEPMPQLSAQHCQTEPGLGVSAQVEGQQVVLGNQDWLTKNGIELTPAEEALVQPLFDAGKTVIFVGIDGLLAGYIGAQDSPREDARQTLDELKHMGLRVMLLTGDNRPTALSIARQLGLADDQVIAEVQPHEKVDAIARLQQDGQCVAMVGDGINDAPALTQADVSISLHSATEVAIESAEIVLMSDRLTDVVRSIQLGHAIFRKIRQNLFWAFIYNVIGIPIAAGLLLPGFGIILSPATAGALMAFSSVSVVSNALLLRRRFPTLQHPSTVDPSVDSP